MLLKNIKQYALSVVARVLHRCIKSYKQSNETKRIKLNYIYYSRIKKRYLTFFIYKKDILMQDWLSDASTKGLNLRLTLDNVIYFI